MENQEIIDKNIMPHVIIEHHYGEGNHSVELDISFIENALNKTRADEPAECVAELEKLRSKTHQDEELIGIDQAIAALKHEAKTNEVE